MNTEKNYKQLGNARRKTKRVFHKMNCSPMVKGRTPVQNSCFTNKTLAQITQYYNKKNPDTAIHSTNPQEVWNQMKDRLSTCSQEDCWLKEIEDSDVREKLDKYLFAPDHPKEWLKNPNEWLSNYDIFDVLHQYEETYKCFKFLGPTPIDFDARPSEQNGKCVWDELCNFSISKYTNEKPAITKIGVVFNLDKHDESGSHWISLFIDMKEKFIFFLDSAGEKIPPEVDTLIKRIIEQGKELPHPIDFDYFENHPLEHQMENTECGMYSLYFIISMLTGQNEVKKFHSRAEKIDFFRKKRIPDKYVNKFRKIYFNSPRGKP